METEAKPEIRSHDVPDHTMEREGKLYIAFERHAVYYSVPLSNTALCAAIRQALKDKREVVFMHDRHCRISSIE